MHMISAESLLARAVFTRSIRLHAWQPGSQNPGSTIFRKKQRPFFLNFVGPVTPPWVLYPSEIKHMLFTERLLARAVFARSNQVLGWQPGAPKSPGARFSGKKTSFFLKFIGPVTTLCVLQPSQIMHMISTESLLSRATFTRSIKVPGWQPGAPKPGSMIFRKKNVLIF